MKIMSENSTVILLLKGIVSDLSEDDQKIIKSYQKQLTGLIEKDPDRMPIAMALVSAINAEEDNG